jgi:quercetin dioxygenase-like cupin family protein
MKEAEMRNELVWRRVGGVTLGVVLCVGTIQATLPSGFTSTTIAAGRLEEVDVDNHAFSLVDFRGSAQGRDLWMSSQRTKGPSDLYVQSNVWQPGGTSGWHTHPGHSLITVTAGSVTAYEGDDPACTPHVYTPGMSFVDEGGDHVHVVRNEGFTEARTITVQVIPAGATRRIDAERNLACGF